MSSADSTATVTADGRGVAMPARLVAWARARVLGRPAVLFAVAAAGAWAVLLCLGRGLTFWSDEWAFIDGRSLTSLDSLLRPHNEHWSTLPVIAYRALFEIVGLHSYLPYLALLLALHVAVAGLVYVLLARRNGPWIALAASVVVLFLGSGVENLLWAFEIGFVGATALGLLALVCLDTADGWRGYAATALLLTIALATAGVAIFFCVMVGVELLLERRRWRGLPWLAVPAGAYAAWYLTWGRTGVDTYGHPFTAEAVLRLPGFVAAGIGSALTSFTGVPAELAVLAFVVVVAWGAWRAFRGFPVPPRTVGALAGILTQYVLIGLVRGQLGDWAAGYPRYAYETVVLLIVGLSPWLARMRVPSGRRARLACLVAAVLVFEVLMVVNLRFLVGGRALFADRAGQTRALVTVALRYGDAANVDPNRSLVLVPSPARLRDLVSRYGDPTRDDLAGEAVAPITEQQMDQAFVRLAGGAVPLTPVDAVPVAGGSTPRLAEAVEVRTTSTGSCLGVSALGSGASATVDIGSEAYVRASVDLEEAAFMLGHGSAAPQPSDTTGTMAGGTWYAVRLPVLDDGEPWLLGIRPVANASIDICAGPDR